MAENSGVVKEEQENGLDQRACFGCLYFSQALLDSGKQPTCVPGLRRQVANPQDLKKLRATEVPEGSFKYVCLGFSLYNTQQWKKRDRELGDVDLPYCEGLEIVSATQMQRTPAVPLNTAGLDADAQPPSTPASTPGPPIRPGRSFIPGASGGEDGSFDWSTFPEKYMKTSGRILTRMQKDLNLIVAKVKENLARLSDRGRSGD